MDRFRAAVLKPDDIDFDHYLRETDAAEKVRPASDYVGRIMHEISPAHDMPKSPKLPFKNGWLYFHPGEVTLWAGFNGSFKSMLQGQVITEIALEGEAACIASFEMKPWKTLTRIVKGIYRSPEPRLDQVESFVKRVEGKLWVYDQQGNVQIERLIAVIKYCADKLSCKHFVVDSLMKVTEREDDYNEQKAIVNRLTICARDLNIHIHLVAHTRKSDEDKLPTKQDVSGTAAVTNLVDNVLILWRNKKKERTRDAGEKVDETHPDLVLICDKQRNGDWEGRVNLWFDRGGVRFDDEKRRGIL